MSPTEVVVLRRRPTTSAVMGTLIGGLVAQPLLAGLALMLLVPLAHESLGTPDLHPGYLPSVALVFLARMFLGGLRGQPPAPDFTAKR